MSALSLAPRLLQELAEPAPVGDSIKAAITRAYRAVRPHLPDGPVREKFTYARAENIWRGESRRIDADEMDAIRAAYDARDRAFREEFAEARALASHLESLASRVAPDGDLRSDRVSRDAARELREAADEARRLAHTLRRAAEADAASRLTRTLSHRGRA